MPELETMSVALLGCTFREHHIDQLTDYLMIHQSKQATPNCHGDEAIPVRFKDRLYRFKKFVLSISGCMNDIDFDPVGSFVRIVSTKSV